MGFFRQVYHHARGGIGLALPQQRINAHRVILGRELCAVEPGKVKLDRIGHQPAAPCPPRLVQCLGALHRGQRQRIARAGRVGERGMGIEEAQHLVLRWRFGLERGLGPQTQDVRLGEARPSKHEARVVSETVRAAGLQHFPAGDGPIHRAGLAGDQILSAAPVLRCSGKSAHRKRRVRENRGNHPASIQQLAGHAGHSAYRLLIRR